VLQQNLSCVFLFGGSSGFHPTEASLTQRCSSLRGLQRVPFWSFQLGFRAWSSCLMPSSVRFPVPTQQVRAIRAFFLSCAADSTSGAWSPVFSSSCIQFLATKLGFSRCECIARLAVCLVSLASQGAWPCSSLLLSCSCLVSVFDFQ
jgi:hypothetical protein